MASGTTHRPPASVIPTSLRKVLTTQRPSVKTWILADGTIIRVLPDGRLFHWPQPK